MDTRSREKATLQAFCTRGFTQTENCRMRRSSSGWRRSPANYNSMPTLLPFSTSVRINISFTVDWSIMGVSSTLDCSQSSTTVLRIFRPTMWCLSSNLTRSSRSSLGERSTASATTRWSTPNWAITLITSSSTTSSSQAKRSLLWQK